MQPTACPVDMPASERLWVNFWPTAPNHGSTAWLSFFMSGRCSTMCAGGAWQCEAKKTCNVTNSSSGRPRPLLGFPDVWGTRPCHSHEYSMLAAGRKRGRVWLLQHQLRGLSRIWNLSLPVLVTKWAPYFIPSSADLEALNRAPPVRALAGAGVRRLRYATAALYRPWCLWPLSSDAQKERRANLTQWAHEELGFLERHVNQHAAVTAAGLPALVASFADLLWRPERVSSALQAFAPCAGRLSARYDVSTNSELRPSNKIKTSRTQGSIAAFGERFNASQLGYDLEGSRCQAGSRQLYRGLGDAEVERARRAEAQLRRLADRWIGHEQAEVEDGEPELTLRVGS